MPYFAPTAISGAQAALLATTGMREYKSPLDAEKENREGLLDVKEYRNATIMELVNDLMPRRGLFPAVAGGIDADGDVVGDI